MISVGFCGLYLFLTNVTFFAGSMDHKVDMPEIMTVWGIFFPLGQSSGTDRLTELCQCAYTYFPNTTMEWIKCARVMT